MAKTKIDDAIFSEVKARADDLEQMYAERNTVFEAYEKMYLMDWDDKPTVDGLMETISPDARNALLGARRLLVATDPIFSVPADDGGKRIDNSDDIELAAKRLWIQAGRASRMPPHYDMVSSALLYGEVHVAITSTADMLEAAKKQKGNAARLERLAQMTPYLFNIWNPKQGYPEFDVAGLRGYYRKVDVRVYELAARFGEAVEAFVAGRTPTDEVELGMWYDDVNYAVWVEDQPIIAMPHELPFIPVSVTLTGGSMLFEKPEQQRQPLLYTLKKSGLWKRQNLVYTTLYTNVFNIGINPTFIHTGAPGDPDPQDVAMDTSTPGGQITLKYGEKLEPMATKGIIDPSFGQALQIADQKATESTIYKQAMGEPLSGNAAFSTVSLLSQSGRLPLIETQKLCSEAIADVMEKALLWYRNSGQQSKSLGIKPKDVPEFLQIDVKLDVDLPQDKLQMANITGMLTRKDNPITTKAWARENILNIGQSGQMDEDILAELAFEMLSQQYLAQRMQQQAMQMQAQQQQQQQGQPQGGQQIPPEMLQQMTAQQGGVQGGAMPTAVGAEGQGMNPGMGGLPPQMAGMIPGMGQGQMSPEGLPPEMMGGV